MDDQNAPNQPPLTPEEVEATVARIPATLKAWSLIEFINSMDIDRLMAERLDLEDMPDVKARESLVAFIERRIAELQHKAG